MNFIIALNSNEVKSDTCSLFACILVMIRGELVGLVQGTLHIGDLRYSSKVQKTGAYTGKLAFKSLNSDDPGFPGAQKDFDSNL